jgi:hypothetical protein
MIRQKADAHHASAQRWRGRSVRIFPQCASALPRVVHFDDSCPARFLRDFYAPAMDFYTVLMRRNPK